MDNNQNPLHLKSIIQKKDYTKTKDLFDLDPKEFKNMSYEAVLLKKIIAGKAKMEMELNKPIFDRDFWLISKLKKAVEWNEKAFKEIL